MSIKFANFALLEAINNAMKEEGLDWRLEKNQRGKHMWSHVYLRNNTGTEDIAHLLLYIDTDNNIVYPVIWARGAECYEDLRNKITDQANVSLNSLNLNMKKSVKRIVSTITLTKSTMSTRSSIAVLQMIG